MRDKLINLLWSVECEGEEGFPYCPERRYGGCRSINKLIMCQVGAIADHLLKNGVIVPPCKVGDKVYWVENNTEIKSGKVRQWGYENHIWLVVDVSKSKCVVLNEERGIFLTKEEAEKALEGQKK